MSRIAAACRRPYQTTVIREDAKGEKVYRLVFGGTTVRFPGYERPLSLVVVDGFGERPLMLLTTLRVGRSRKSLWRVVESYLARWRVEETIRFIKQSYQVEDIRLLTYERLRTMALLVMAVAYFACVYLGRRAKLHLLVHHVYTVSQRIYGVPEFRFYAIADGIREVCYGRSKSRTPLLKPLPSTELLYEVTDDGGALLDITGRLNLGGQEVGELGGQDIGEVRIVLVPAP